jgi:two-component system chemotaxis response regulator CheY
VEEITVGFDFSMPVLVVEDFSTMAHIISGLLRQIGFQQVDVAQGGTTALAKMRNTRYGLVISDLNMQPISGLGLLKHIRSDSTLAHARFIMMSAGSSLNHVRAAMAAGADNYLVKPFTAPTLKAKIDAVFGDKGLNHVDA